MFPVPRCLGKTRGDTGDWCNTPKDCYDGGEKDKCLFLRMILTTNALIRHHGHATDSWENVMIGRKTQLWPLWMHKWTMVCHHIPPSVCLLMMHVTYFVLCLSLPPREASYHTYLTEFFCTWASRSRLPHQDAHVWNGMRWEWVQAF